jgi:hypothetical protein
VNFWSLFVKYKVEVLQMEYSI